jgi:hypothetical protein
MTEQAQMPTVGRIVLYKMTEQDVIHHGDVGTHVPAIVVGVNGSQIYLRVFQNDDRPPLCRLAVHGDGSGHWSWPPRA